MAGLLKMFTWPALIVIKIILKCIFLCQNSYNGDKYVPVYIFNKYNLTLIYFKTLLKVSNICLMISRLWTFMGIVSISILNTFKNTQKLLLLAANIAISTRNWHINKKWNFFTEIRWMQCSEPFWNVVAYKWINWFNNNKMGWQQCTCKK